MSPIIRESSGDFGVPYPAQRGMCSSVYCLLPDDTSALVATTNTGRPAFWPTSVSMELGDLAWFRASVSGNHPVIFWLSGMKCVNQSESGVSE